MDLGAPSGSLSPFWLLRRPEPKPRRLARARTWLLRLDLLRRRRSARTISSTLTASCGESTGRVSRHPISTARSIRPTTPRSPWRDGRPSESAARKSSRRSSDRLDAVEKANAGASAIAKALDRDHDTFEGVPAKDREDVEKFVAASGYPSEFAHHLKLWFLAILTATPPCEAQRQALGLPEVDQFLAETASDFGRQGGRARNGCGADRRDLGDPARDRRDAADRRRARAD